VSSLWSSRLAISSWKRKGGRQREKKGESKKERQKKKKQGDTWQGDTRSMGLCKQLQVLGDSQKTPRDGNMVEIQLQGGTGLVWLLLGIQERFLFSVVDCLFIKLH